MSSFWKISWSIFFNVTVKTLFLGLVLFIIAFPDLPRFAGKGMMERAMIYPLAAFILPLFWRLQKRQIPFPYLADTMIVLPFLIDLAGNAANFYDTLALFDDFAHFLNWFFLVSGFGIILSYYPLGRLNRAALAVGFGATTHILWELGEYLAMKLGAFRLFLTYEDTVSDLALSLLGSFTAALATSLFLNQKQKT